MGWLLVLIFIGLIGILVYRYIQDDTKDVITPHIPPKPAEEPRKEPQKEPQIANYTSIYQYTEAKAAKRCPYCDGENGFSVKICRICGGHQGD